MPTAARVRLRFADCHVHCEISVCASQRARDEPVDLTCPLTFSLFRDPVVLASGHTYERSAIEEFWSQRPLANPLGGAPLANAVMLINFMARSQVDAWLDAHPDDVPQGWSSREDATRSRSSNEDLVEAARCYERRVEAKAFSVSAELAQAETSVWILGHVPRGRTSLRTYVSMRAIGEYELCAELPLSNERHVYARKQDDDVCLWHVSYPQCMWVVGPRDLIGTPRGVLNVRSDARTPESIVGTWSVGGSLAPALYCCGAADGRQAFDAQRTKQRDARLPQLLLPALSLAALAFLISGCGGGGGRVATQQQRALHRSYTTRLAREHKRTSQHCHWL